MSATVTATEAPPPAKGKKKLIIIIAAVLVLVLGGGGAAVMMMKKKAAAAEAEAEGEGETGKSGAKKATSKTDPKSVPAFVPLDPFTVNLADRQADRYAQIGITLEIEDAQMADQIKNYMPAIRNNILLAIADRTADDLMGREGKAKLANRVKVEVSRAMGYDVPDDESTAEEETEEAEEKKPKKKAKRKPKAEVQLPITAVHFSNFIVQ
jgi:flagellar protein FliL